MTEPIIPTEDINKKYTFDSEEFSSLVTDIVNNYFGPTVKEYIQNEILNQISLHIEHKVKEILGERDNKKDRILKAYLWSAFTRLAFIYGMDVENIDVFYTKSCIEECLRALGEEPNKSFG